MDESEIGVIDEANFKTFMGWFKDAGIADRDPNVADMLATQFGDIGWAASGTYDIYKDVLAKRLADKDAAKQDSDDLLQKFHEYTANADDALAPELLVNWLAQKMRQHGWDTHTVPEYDSTARAWYRYDTVAGAYQWEDSSSGRWLTEQEFAESQPGDDGPGEQRFGEPEFDESSYLWYRYDYSASAYQWAEANPDARVDESAVWLTEAAVMERRRFSAPQMDARTGTRYRFDSHRRVYQWEDPAARHTWLSEAEFTARRTVPAASAAAEFSEAVFDGNYGMWYRYHPASRSYQWAVGDRDSAPPPDAAWMTQSQADRFRAEQEALNPHEQIKRMGFTLDEAAQALQILIDAINA